MPARRPGRPRASDRAYERLLDEIQSGMLPVGTPLAEIEQAARLGMSRTPVREALARLLADGLVARHSPRITVVTGLDVQDIEQLFVLRCALEDAAVRLAASRGDGLAFNSLATGFAHARFSDRRGINAYYDLVARFDAALDAAIANHHLTAALRRVRAHLDRVRWYAPGDAAGLAESAAERRRIAAAIAAGDAELAAEATRRQLALALDGTLRAFRQSRS